MGKPSPPPTPDYKGAAQAQGQANIDAAKIQGKFNNPNVISPYGTQTVSYGGGFNQAGYDQAQQNYQSALAAWQAPSPGRGLFTVLRGPAPVAPNRDNFLSGDPNQATLTQTLSPAQQMLLDKSQHTQGLLADLASQGATSAQGVLGEKIDYSGAPAMPGSSAALRDQVYDAQMARVNQDIGIQKNDLNSNLVAAGIRPGTPAYDNAMNLISRQQTDAQNQAIINSGNQAQQAQGMDLANRNQYLQEYANKLNMPLNQITALMSGSQVNNPFQIPTYAQNANVAPAPLYDAFQQKSNYNTDIYNQKAAQQSNLTQGLFGLAGTAGQIGGLYAMGGTGSDRRVKRRIRRIGTHALGIGLYTFRYRHPYTQEWGHGEKVGVMADEVLTVKPEAVFRRADGILLVDYAQLGGPLS